MYQIENWDKLKKFKQEHITYNMNLVGLSSTEKSGMKQQKKTMLLETPKVYTKLWSLKISCGMLVKKVNTSPGKTTQLTAETSKSIQPSIAILI